MHGGLQKRKPTATGKGKSEGSDFGRENTEANPGSGEITNNGEVTFCAYSSPDLDSWYAFLVVQLHSCLASFIRKPRPPSTAHAFEPHFRPVSTQNMLSSKSHLQP